MKNVPIEDAFDPTGYKIEPSILERDEASAHRTWLIEREAALLKRLAHWVGEPIAATGGYKFHQERTADYVEQGLDEDLRHFLRGEFDLETRLERRFVDFLSRPDVRSRIAAAIGLEQFLAHYPPMVRFIPPDAQASAVPPHQDVAYNMHIENFATLWIPFCDIDDECGGVVVYEGSHRSRAAKHKAEGSWESGIKTAPKTFEQVPVHMKAGDGLLFPWHLIHRSAPNRSNRTRYSLDVRLFTNPKDTTKSYYDPFSNTLTRRH